MADKRQKQSLKQQRASFGVGGSNDDVGTPEALKKVLRAEFGPMWDPCPLGGKKRGGVDGLKRSWKMRGERWVFCNPPYSETEKWLEKGVEELIEHGVQSVFLVPARLWRHYQFEIVFPYAAELRIIKGGLRFKGYDSAAPMGSMLVIFARHRAPRPKRLRVLRAGDFEFLQIVL